VLYSGGVAKQGRNKKANIRVMVGHGEPRVTALGVVKGPPAVSKVDVGLLHGSVAGLRGRPVMKGATEAVLVINLDIWGIRSGCCCWMR